MESESTREEVEERLRDTAEAMSDRMASLEDELSSSGTTLRDWVVDNPWKSVGAMMAAGVAVGVLFGGSGSTRRPKHDELLDKYVDALRAEIDDAVASGASPGEALERALRGRVPLVILDEDTQENSGGVLGLLGSGTAYLLRILIREFGHDLILSMLDGVDVEPDQVDGAEG